MCPPAPWALGFIMGQRKAFLCPSRQHKSLLGRGREGKGGEGPNPDPVRGSMPWPPHVCTAGVLQDLRYCSFERRWLEPAQQPWEDCHCRPGRFH